MFRYRMIRETGCCWVDADLVCLTKPSFAAEPYIFCRQADAVGTLLVNNAVLRLPPVRAGARRTRRDGRKRDRRRSEMGRARPLPADARPDETRALRQGARSARLLPHRTRAVLEAVPAELSGSRRRKCAGARAVHLWSEAIRWSDYDLSVCPPDGSYLHECFRSGRRCSTVSAASPTRTKCAA